MSRVSLHHGDCLEVLSTLPDCSVDAVVTDPPYGLSFMGRKWDYDVPSVDVWAECLRVLKPGGHLLAFAGTRTQHRMCCRIEDAGFEIRDMIAWVYGSGFPKSLDVSKAIDARGGASVAWFGPWFRKWREDRGITQKQVAALFPSKTGGLTGCVANWELGFNMPTPEQFNLIRDTFGLPFQSIEAAEREVIGSKRTGDPVAWYAQSERGEGIVDITAPATDAARKWSGWGTALKPALEPITVARKPLIGTVAENVLTHGTGAINVDGCRVAGEPWKAHSATGLGSVKYFSEGNTPIIDKAPHDSGRWPANLIHDGSGDVLAGFPSSGPSKARTGKRTGKRTGTYGEFAGQDDVVMGHDDEGGSAARFFYCAKASKRDRDEGVAGVAGVAGVGALRDGGRASLPRKNHHPTVKPTDLMRYLCRLVTPPSGVVLDPFMGSGSTGKAAVAEGFRFIGIEREAEYVEIARARIGQPTETLFEVSA